MPLYKSEIKGNLDIIIHQKEEEIDGVLEKWKDILIHGDPEGLRSLALLVMKLADLNQDNITDLPIGAREHIHLRPGQELSRRSESVVIIGRLDAKGTGKFYDRYIPAKK
jgi:hypothetical protein